MSLIAVELSATTATSRKAGSETPGNAANSQAVKEVVEGQRRVANAAWWGFIEEDKTEALQAAINFGAKRVVVSNMTRNWIGRPTQLAGNQDLGLENGAVITAKRGEYSSRGVSVFIAHDVSNSNIRGYRATVRMALALRGVTNVKISGLTPRDNYGDGIEVFLAHLKAESCEVSRLIDNGRVLSRRGAGIRLMKVQLRGLLGGRRSRPPHDHGRISR